MPASTPSVYTVPPSAVRARSSRKAPAKCTEISRDCKDVAGVLEAHLHLLAGREFDNLLAMLLPHASLFLDDLGERIPALSFLTTKVLPVTLTE
ncbi:MAG: hypothetical protein ACRDN9_06740 [Streptosporangiaceae bacterium]